MNQIIMLGFYTLISSIIIAEGIKTGAKTIADSIELSQKLITSNK